jgi:hypothetical protein
LSGQRAVAAGRTVNLGQGSRQGQSRPRPIGGQADKLPVTDIAEVGGVALQVHDDAEVVLLEVADHARSSGHRERGPSNRRNRSDRRIDRARCVAVRPAARGVQVDGAAEGEVAVNAAAKGRDIERAKVKLFVGTAEDPAVVFDRRHPIIPRRDC